MTKPLSWSPEQEKLIAQLMEKEKITRMAAVRRVSAGRANITAKMTQPKELNKKLRELGDKAPHVAAVKKVSRKAVKAITKAVALKDNYKPGPELREQIDSLVRKTLRDQFNEICPILGSLGQRYMPPSVQNGYPYERLLAQTPKGLFAVFVGGLHNGEPTVTFTPAVKSSYTVRKLLDRLSRKQKSLSKKAQ
jgi:hypothetical protein